MNLYEVKYNDGSQRWMSYSSSHSSNSVTERRQENNRKASKKHQQKSLTVWKYKPDDGTVHNPACQRTSAVQYTNKLSKPNTKEII